MRKALIAVIVASALFAVGAFAASFVLETENVASQTGAVGSCAPKAVVNFDTSETISTAITPNDFTVTTVTVTFTDTNNVETESCDGAKADLAVNVGTGWVDATSEAVDGATASFDVSGSNIPVKTVVGVAVLADGAEVTTTTPSV